jgi:hypothetical protein
MGMQKEKILVKQDKITKPKKKQKECSKKVKDCMSCRILDCPEEEA